MNSIKVESKRQAPVRRQDLGIKEVKDSNKMEFLIPNTVTCRVVFKPA